MTQSLSIGIVAHALTPELVFVRVPNERGRWMLVDRCVVEVDCPHCKAVTGEPCRAEWKKYNGYGDGNPWKPIPASDIRYHVAVHVARKQACSDAHGVRRYANRLPPYKTRINADELAAAQTPLNEDPEQ